MEGQHARRLGSGRRTLKIEEKKKRRLNNRRDCKKEDRKSKIEERSLEIERSKEE